MSKRLLLLYREKIKAEHEKTLHERQIGINVSHELNTPVAIIKGYLDTIVADPELPEPQKSCLFRGLRTMPTDWPDWSVPLRV